MSNKKIFLLGDVVRHVYLKPADETDETNTQYEKKGEYKVFTQNMRLPSISKIVCPPLIKKMIVKATGVSENEIAPEYEFIYQPDVPSLSLFRVLRKFPRTSKKTDESKVYRVDQAAEYFGSELFLVETCSGVTDTKDGANEEFEVMKQLLGNINNINPELLVLYDRNSDLRDYIKKNKEEQKELTSLFNNGTIKAFVISIKENINDDKWLDILSKLVKKKKEKCIVIITADALRHAGLDITEYGTNEQYIRQIVDYLDKEPLSKIYDNLCGHLVVIFRENQALYINKASKSGSYHYCPYFDRPAQTRPEQYGKMPGKFTIQVTSIVKYLYKPKNVDLITGEEESINKVIAKALRFGIVAYNRYFDAGYCVDKKNSKKTPFDALFAAVDCSGKNERNLYKANWEEKELYVSSLDFCINQLDKTWNRSDALFKNYSGYSKKFLKEIKIKKKDEQDREQDRKKERYVLHEIVKNGLESVTLKKDMPKGWSKDLFGDSKILCPHLELGNMKIIDEEHMKGFIDLAQLFRSYLRTDNKSEQPLCIAVFGSPGEGKSYSIKQILKHVSPERKSEELTFNLAQFNSVEQLTEAFHKTQDQVLKQPGEPPLIIFDEFDAKFDEQELGWLKYFLAPMQDDLFRGKSAEYKVGRAIFVFSGGTSKCFSEFKEKLKDRMDDRKAVKLDDFISRLRGFMNVKGVNSDEDNGNISRIVKLRRAIVLRSFLEKHAKLTIFSTDGKSARIHDKVIDAFLDTKKYHFGVRSMEAIIQMSRWIDKEFEPSSLPSLEQLEMHVTTEAFQEILSHNKTLPQFSKTSYLYF